MELRQLRYFLSVLEYGSLGRAAVELGVGASALSQQLSKLESEVSTRLLTRSSTGVSPTAAGLASNTMRAWRFVRRSTLSWRHKVAA